MVLASVDSMESGGDDSGFRFAESFKDVFGYFGIFLNSKRFYRANSSRETRALPTNHELALKTNVRKILPEIILMPLK